MKKKIILRDFFLITNRLIHIQKRCMRTVLHQRHHRRHFNQQAQTQPIQAVVPLPEQLRNVELTLAAF